MSYIPTNKDLDNLAKLNVIGCTRLVAHVHPLLDAGTRTSVTLATMTTGAAQMAMIALAMNEIIGDGIDISLGDLTSRINEKMELPAYAARLRRLHDRLKRAIVEETGLSEVKAPDSHSDN